MRIRSAVATLALLFVPALGAQTVADHLALGDKAHAAMDAADALKHYEAAMAADPKSYEALWKASREAVDAGEFSAAKERSLLMDRQQGGWLLERLQGWTRSVSDRARPRSSSGQPMKEQPQQVGEVAAVLGQHLEHHARTRSLM